MKGFNRASALILTFCLVFGLFAAAPVSAADKPSVEVTFETTGKTVSVEGTPVDVYKMVVSANSNAGTGITLINTVFSMDANVIKPVKRGGTYTIADIANDSTEKGCFLPTAKYNYDEKYTSPGAKWKVKGTKQAFDYGVSTMGNSIDAEYNIKQPMFEFYFAVVGNPYKGCIKLETDNSDGSFLSDFYADVAQRNGILIDLENVEASFLYSKDTKQIDYLMTYSNDPEFADKVTKINITTPPADTDYIEGQTFDPAGMVVTATYADGTTGAVTGYATTPSGALSTGDTVITVTYTDPFDEAQYTDTQAITVAAKEISAIAADFNPGNNVIYTSNTLASLEQYLTVTATFNDGTTGELDATRYVLNGDLTGDGTSGTREITVTAGDGKTATFVVNVTAVALSSIEATFNQGATEYYTTSPLNSLKGNLVVKGINNDASTFVIGADDYTLSGTLTAGQSTITVTHTASGMTATFTVNVTDVAVDNLELTGAPGKTAYNAFEAFDSTGLTVTAHYNNGTSGDVTNQVTYIYANGSDSFRAGETYIDISYGGKTVRQGGLTVAKLQVAKPAVTNGPLTYTGNAQSPTIATNNAYDITGNSKTAAGDYAATVKLNDKVNYEWAGGGTADLSLAWSIDQKTLTVSDGTYAVSKGYDGTTEAGNATGTLELTGIVGADDVSATVAVVPDYPAANAGTHTITLTVGLSGADKANYKLNSTSYDFTSATITQALIAKPTVTNDPLTYTGNAQSPTIATNPAYTITKNSETDAGDYAAIVTLNDKANYDWVGGGDENLSLAWSIVKANPAIDVTYTGGTLYSSSPLPALTVTGTPGTAVLDASQTLQSGTHNYSWTYTPADAKNYNTKTGTISLTVVQVTLLKIEVTTPPTKTIYNAFEAFDPTDMVVTATYNNNDTNVVTGQVVFEYANGSNSFRASETGVTVSFTQDSVTKTALVPVTVNKIQIAKPAVTSGPLTYNGNAQSPTITTNNAYDITGNSRTAAGNYTATVALNDKANYEWNDGTSADLDLAWSIDQKDLSATATVAPIPDKLWTGNAIEPTITVSDGATTLAAGTGYEVGYAGNTGPGVATITITFKGNYKGTKTVNFNINNRTEIASRAIVSADIADPAIKDHLANEGKYTVAASTRNSENVNEFEIAVKGTSVLTAYESSDPLQGSGNWIGVILGGFKVNNGPAAGTTDLFYSVDGNAYTQLSAADLAEVQSVGGADGEFILWLKSETIGAGVDRYIATDAAGANKTKITVTFTAYVPSGGGGGRTKTPPPVVNPPVTTGDTTTVTTTVTPSTTGTTSTATVPPQNMDSAVNSAVETSASSGTDTNVEVQVNAPQNASEVRAVLPASSVNTLLEEGTNSSLTVSSNVVRVTFDEPAIEAITEEAQGQDITVVAREVDAKTLSDEQKALVGDRPVLDLVVMSGGKVISDFKGGNATVSVPYTLREGETAEGLVIWFMTDDGQLIEKPCTFDAVTGMLTFTTGHFSNYVLGYFPFVDMEDSAWYYENGVYAYTNKLISGVSSDRFDPLGKTTRAMVVTILWRLDGKPAAAPNGFKDVPASWYSDAVSWAAANGIVSGYSSEKFGPSDPITREQMSAIIYNYGVYKGYDMSDRKDLTAFTDNSKVSAWAQNSMQWAVAKGIISGVRADKLDPAGNAQRAQVTAILQRFIENVK